MKVVKFCLLPLMVLLAIPFVIGYFMDEEWTVEVSAVIEAPPAVIHPLIEDLRRWEQWNVFHQEMPDATYRFEGEERGVGAVMITEAGRSSVRLEITASLPMEGVWFDELLEGSVPAKGAITYEVIEGAGGSPATRVKWWDRGSLGSSPIYRLFVPLMQAQLEEGFERNLLNLKRLIEAGEVEPTELGDDFRTRRERFDELDDVGESDGETDGE